MSLEAVRRVAARVLCVDPDGRVLMVRSVDPGTPGEQRWVAPGGGVEHGEDPHDAARREVWEELGLSLDDLGERIRTSEDAFSFDGTPYLQTSHWYAVRTRAFEPTTSAMAADEAATVRGVHWCHPDDLDALADRPGHVVAPAGTAEWVRAAHRVLPPHVVRPAVRVLVVDEADRVLLMEFRAGLHGGAFWAAPGGGVEVGETHDDAVRRELAEEVGLTVAPGERPWREVWRRRHAFTLSDGQPLEQRERWYLLRVPAFEPDVAGWTDEERELVSGLRWWTPEELAACGNGPRHTPADLADRLPALLAAERSGTLTGDVEEVGL